jgi:hypothetical protein
VRDEAGPGSQVNEETISPTRGNHAGILWMDGPVAPQFSGMKKVLGPSKTGALRARPQTLHKNGPL